MAYLVGIDEAGYGPLLGPLAVSAAVMEMPEAHLAANHWDLLSAAVAPAKKNLHGRLLVTDSKKAFNQKTGIDTLLRTSLAFLALSDQSGGVSPETPNKGDSTSLTAYDFLNRVCPDCLPRLLEYPWYQKFDSHFLEFHPGHSVSVACLKTALGRQNMRFGGVLGRCADVKYLNQKFAAVKNKSRVLFGEVCTLIHALYRRYAGSETLQFVIDRQGGRADYSRELMLMFPNFDLTILKMDQKVSSYELTGPKGAMRVHFVVGADDKYLLVGLASMFSKLIRELCMYHLNAYFTETYKDIRPTAGYWNDGQRFIKDLDLRLNGSKLDRNMLIRNK